MRTSLFGSVFLAFMLTFTTVAAAPPSSEVSGLKLPDKVEGEAEDWIVVTATTDGKVVRWVSMDPGLKVFPSDLLKDSKTVVVSAKAPGSYRLLAYTTVGDAPTLPAYTTIVVAGAPPAPIPGPGPAPGPGPGPTPPAISKAWVLVVEETQDASADRGAFFTDKDLAHFIEGKKSWKVKVVDKDIIDPSTGKTPASLKPWFAKVNMGDLPQVLVIDQDGAVRHQSKLPKTPAELLAILKKL